MTPWDFLNRRLSVPSRLLGEPSPDDATVEALITLAARVPDHGRLAPWRFIRVADDARHVLGERLAALTKARDPEAPAAALDKDRGRFNRAPLVIIVVARLTPGHKVPEQEQLLSAGLAAYNLLLGAEALGFGAQWLTGWPAYDAEVDAMLGLAANERIVAFIHIGTPTGPGVERPRPGASELLADWQA
jgi:nitroreductase